VQISELARRAGASPSAIRWYEGVGILPPPNRRPNNYRDYDESDLSRLRLVISLRRLGLGPEDAGRLARLCVEHGGVDLDLAPLIAAQRKAVDTQRSELDRLDAELIDLEHTIAAIGRVRTAKEGTPISEEIHVTIRPIRVLFVCTGNSARSQIAEALLSRFGGADFEVDSAGTEPRGVNPVAVRVLGEYGIDWSTARSKPVSDFVGQSYDYVITVCDRARQACPVFPGSDNTLHWGLDDPSEIEGSDAERMTAFRQTAMELTIRLRPFIEIARRSAGRGLQPIPGGRP
jgi:arsenate reductase (thioredoxin)